METRNIKFIKEKKNTGLILCPGDCPEYNLSRNKCNITKGICLAEDGHIRYTCYLDIREDDRANLRETAIIVGRMFIRK